MFNWLINLFAGSAYGAAMYSGDSASYWGMHQMKEPKGLQKLAKESKKAKNN